MPKNDETYAVTQEINILDQPSVGLTTRGPELFGLPLDWVRIGLPFFEQDDPDTILMIVRVYGEKADVKDYEKEVRKTKSGRILNMRQAEKLLDQIASGRRKGRFKDFDKLFKRRKL